MMYCTFCGKQIADDAAFCRHCGKPVIQEDTLSGLVDAARRGSQDAVSTLYEKTYSKVYYTIKSMIKDEDAVLDIVQDTYLKAFSHLGSFQGDTKFLPWVRQIAANTARDWLKKKRPVLFTDLGTDNGQDTPVEELFSDERSENLPDRVIDLKETQRLIREIIEELPEDQRAAIGMFYYEEMSVKEIAVSMDASESAVKSRLMYGRGKIEKKVLELEKKGTKLYGLSPLPFLLLLFHNQKLYASETPNPRILRAILGSQLTDAAAANPKATSVRTAATGAGTTPTTDTSMKTAGVSGSLGILKIGLIATVATAIVGLGIFGIARIADSAGKPQKLSVTEDNTGKEETATPEAAEIPETTKILEEAEEHDPANEALEQYRIIISQADSYEYYEHEMYQWTELTGYWYALVQMHPDAPVPALLLERVESDSEISVSSSYVRIFQYDPDTKTVHQPAETIASGIRGGLAMAGDGEGLFDTQWSSGTGQGSVSRITLEGDSIHRDAYWTGQIFDMPDTITSTEIEWHEIEDLSRLDSIVMPEQRTEEPPSQTDSDPLPTDGDRIVLTGTVGTYDYDEIVALQEQPDPNAAFYDEDSWEFVRGRTYRVILLDAPQTLNLNVSGEENDYYSSHNALMLSIDDVNGMEQYEGQHITFSIDPNDAYWPSDTSLPLAQPIVKDIHILN